MEYSQLIIQRPLCEILDLNVKDKALCSLCRH